MMLNALGTGNKKNTYFLLTNKLDSISFESSLLFISFDNDFLYLVVRKKSNNELILVKAINLVSSLEETLKAEQLHQHTWSKVYFVNLKHSHAIIPKQFYTNNHKDNILFIKEDNSIDLNEITISNTSIGDYTFLSTSNNSELNILKNKFHQTYTINSLETRYKGQSKPLCMDLHIKDKSLSILIIKNDKIEFQNTFTDISNLDEVTYYCMYALKKHNINPHDCPVIIHSDKKTYLSIETIFNEYVKEISKAKLDVLVPDDIDISPIYFPLNAYKCIF